MYFLVLRDNEKAENQKITHIIVGPDTVDFIWDIPTGGGGVRYIAAPKICIKELVEEIEKGAKEGIVDCKEQHPYANYMGAKIHGQSLELYYTEKQTTEVQILSVKSLLRLKEAFYP